jgi:Cof subfamily protein (haloacid dehalogenase superfamily)
LNALQRIFFKYFSAFSALSAVVILLICMEPSLPPISTPSPSNLDLAKIDIRLIAIDLDGTLLNSKKQVSPQTLQALKCLPERGVRVVIASARPPRSVRPTYQLLGLDTLQVNYNGALIWNESEKSPVFHRPLKGSIAWQMIEMARDQYDEVIVHLEVMDRWCTDRINDAYSTETGRLFKPDAVGDLATFCQHSITKLMFLGDPRIIARLEPLLLQDFSEQVTIVRQSDELLQIMDHRVSKAVALRKLAKFYGVPMEQVMAIGDAPNDVGMLQIAGVAIAMDNAHKVVKDVADWITPSNDDHGVHAALVRYGLCR